MSRILFVSIKVEFKVGDFEFNLVVIVSLYWFGREYVLVVMLFFYGKFVDCCIVEWCFGILVFRKLVLWVFYVINKYFVI